MLNFFKPKAAPGAPPSTKRKSSELGKLAPSMAGTAAKVPRRQPLQQRQAAAALAASPPSGTVHIVLPMASASVIDLDEPASAAFSSTAGSSFKETHPDMAELCVNDTSAAGFLPGRQAHEPSSIPCAEQPPDDFQSTLQSQQQAEQALGQSAITEAESLATAGPGSGSGKHWGRQELGPPLPNGVSRQHADSLIAMGFSQTQASRALLATQGDLPRAINWILQS